MGSLARPVISSGACARSLAIAFSSLTIMRAGAVAVTRLPRKRLRLYSIRCRAVRKLRFRPGEGGGEGGDLLGEPRGMDGDEVAELAGEEGVDGGGVAGGEVLEGEDLNKGDADLEVGEAEEVGDDVRGFGAEGGLDEFLRPEVDGE